MLCCKMKAALHTDWPDCHGEQQALTIGPRSIELLEEQEAYVLLHVGQGLVLAGYPLGGLHCEVGGFE
jgi:hypothetical protein